MIYTVKFFYSFFLPPGIFIVLLTILTVRLYRREKNMARILTLIAVGLYLSSTSFMGNLLLKTLENGYNPPSVIDGDVLIMLGGGATQDTPDIDGLGQLSDSGGNRLLTTARLHKKTGLLIILSSGRVFDDTGDESQIAKRQLIGLGVPENKIIVENTSRNTRENAQNTKQILEKNGFRKPLLITSAFHIKRAVKNFNKVGIVVQPYPTDYKVSKKSVLYLNKFVPSYTGLFQTGMALREYLGLLAFAT